MSPWTPPVNEFNGGKKATDFEKLQSLAKTVKLCFFFYSTGLCTFASRNNICACLGVGQCESRYAGFACTHTHTLTHTWGTRVLLISAWAAERPLKVSLKWWMFCRAQASVFNLSHWRTSTASTSMTSFHLLLETDWRRCGPSPLNFVSFLQHIFWISLCCICCC